MTSSMREGTDANGSATAPAETEECAVQPSAPLINILHRRLRDPSIVTSFERRHSNNHSAEGLLLARPHWFLQTASGAAVEGEDNYELNAQKSSFGDGASSAAPIGRQSEKPDPAAALDAVKVGTTSSSLPMINSIPKRNYIDLRIQQNEIFANHQYTKCSMLLSNLKKIQHQQEQQSSKKQQLQLHQKVANDIQSLLNEGLAACPNHEGLVNVHKEYKDWIVELNGTRIIGSASSGVGRGRPGGTPSGDFSSLNANRTTLEVLSRGNNNNGSAILSNPQMLQQHQQHKGAEGRAQAAMRDALAERSFLLDDDDATKDIGVKYPLLPEADGEIGTEKVKKIDEPEYNSSSDDSDGRSRSRRQGKKSKHKHKRRTSKNKKGKKHRRDHDRKQRKDDTRRRRSRSRSIDSSGSRRSRSISSRSASSSSSVDSYKKSSKRKKYHKKEHKRRKKKKRHHHERAEEGNPKEEDTKSPDVTNEKTKIIVRDKATI